MLKTLGSLLLIAAGTLSGLSISNSYKQRLHIHKKLVRLYNETAILLEYSFPTFGEIVSHLQKSGEYIEFSFLNVDTDEIDVRKAVIDAINNWDKGLESNSEENLRSFFTKLGTTDIQGQISYAKLAAVSEQEFIDSVSEKYKQRAKISRTFGVLGGAMAAIMIA